MCRELTFYVDSFQTCTMEEESDKEVYLTLNWDEPLAEPDSHLLPKTQPHTDNPVPGQQAPHPLPNMQPVPHHQPFCFEILDFEDLLDSPEAEAPSSVYLTDNKLSTSPPQSNPPLCYNPPPSQQYVQPHDKCPVKV